MKGQISTEAFLALVIFFILASALAFSALENKSAFSLKENDFSSKLKSDEASFYCNFLYLKGKSVEINGFPEINADDSMISCFSESYYFNQQNPKVGGIKIWF